MPEADKIRDYWDSRARDAAGAPSATTNDIYLRNLEFHRLTEELRSLVSDRPTDILDVGCGDGKTTQAVARHLPKTRFVGVDFSGEMIAVARRHSSERHDGDPIEFIAGDARQLRSAVGDKRFDVVLTNRCLINIADLEEQFTAVGEIASVLRPGGWYLGTENFRGGQANLNRVRADMALPEIPVRWHNRYFDETEFLGRASARFASVELVNFSSTYYLVTRVVYSALCKREGRSPDYSDPIHEVALQLPSVGDFSPIKLIRARKAD